MYSGSKFYLRLGICLIIPALWLSIIGKQLWHSSASAVKNRTIPIVNLTQSVEVVRVGPVKNFEFTLTIRNTANQAIEDLAYSFDPQKGLNSQNYAIQPGATHDERIGIHPATLNGYPSPQLTILAVSFEDGSGEGASAAVETLLDQDLGMRMGILAVGPIIESLCEQPYERLPRAIERAKEQIQRIPAPPEGHSVGFKAAFQGMIQEGARTTDQLTDIYIYSVYGQEVMNSRLSYTKDQYHGMSSAAKVWLDRFNDRARGSIK